MRSASGASGRLKPGLTQGARSAESSREEQSGIRDGSRIAAYRPPSGYEYGRLKPAVRLGFLLNVPCWKNGP